MSEKKQKKILILENVEKQFVDMKQALASEFGAAIAVSPYYINDNESSRKDLNNYHSVICCLELDGFDKVWEFYKEADLYIIDVNLKTSGTDGLGLAYRNFIREKGIGNTPVIFVSNNASLSIELKEGIEIFISKPEEGRYFHKKLVEQVHRMLNLAYEQKQFVQPSGCEEKEARQGEELPLYKKGTKFGLGYALHIFWQWLDDKTIRAVDKVILFIFYIMLSVTVLSGGVNIFKEFTPLSLKRTEQAATLVGDPVVARDSDTADNSPGKAKTAAEVHANENEAMILKKSEHIFLYLLPIFIVFGFYNYYRTNARIYFVEGNLKNIRHDDSTRGMNMTKVLFIGSIISFVLIKTIEEIFRIGPPNIPKLISAGALLVMLMLYFLRLDGRNHGPAKERGN